MFESANVHWFEQTFCDFYWTVFFHRVGVKTFFVAVVNATDTAVQTNNWSPCPVTCALFQQQGQSACQEIVLFPGSFASGRTVHPPPPNPNREKKSFCGKSMVPGMQRAFSLKKNRVVSTMAACCTVPWARCSLLSCLLQVAERELLHVPLQHP